MLGCADTLAFMISDEAIQNKAFDLFLILLAITKFD